MTSIGKITKEITIHHRKGNIRLNPEFFVLEDAHRQGFLLGTDYQRMYGIDIYHSEIGTSPLVLTRKSNFHLIYTRYLLKIHLKNS